MLPNNSEKSSTQLVKEFLRTSFRPLIVICGPTASGKTKLAVKLCKEFKGEVISADSRQVYTEMEIGNERTKPEEMEGIPHHLIAIVPPDHIFTVAEFKERAEKCIKDIVKRGKIPFLVGGTGLYIDAVTKNFQIPPGDADSDLRKKLELKDTDKLLHELHTVDPEEYESLKQGRNRRYLIRALEIFHTLGMKKSLAATQGTSNYDVLKIGIQWPRETLYKRINQRTVTQVEKGMIEEVQALLKKYSPDLPALSSIGCKEVIPFFEGKITKQQMIETLQQNNRNYAKRQMTWLRRDKEIIWIEGD